MEAYGLEIHLKNLLLRRVSIGFIRIPFALPATDQRNVVGAFYIALIGGLLMGVGFVVLFRHQASLGGINILALYLQQTRGIRAGKLQMGLDITIVLASLTVVTPMALAASILGAFALNLAISLNHRPG